MGVESRKQPPLPAPTETESLATPTEVAASDVSKPADEKSHYSLPDDGTPVTIKTRGHRPNRSQTSLLIEYFEGSKSSRSASPGGSTATERRPSVRVRLTPSKTRGKNDRIQITETKSTRKASLSRKGTASPNVGRSEIDMTDLEDTRSMGSYASATEESNVSRNPIEVEIDPSNHRRRRKVSSPLIPAADSKASTYQPPNMSDISAIPTDSFLDGSGATTITGAERERRARSPLRGEALAAGALGAVAGAAAAEKLNRKHRSASREHDVMQKAVEKASKPERKHKSKSRASSVSEKDEHRRRSKGSHKESVVSAADSSVLSSALSPSHRSYDSHSSSKISINNPKLLETVEDAIRRLILPELDAIKRERSQRESRRSKDRESLSSLTSASREEISTTSKRRSNDTTHSIKSKDQRNREARNDLSPHSSTDQISIHETAHDEELSPRRDRERDRLTDAALGAAVAGAALRSRSRGDEKRQRRRRRAETPKRGSDRYTEEYDDIEHEVVPPMPLSSEINPSEMTRASILSADTDRPHSASEEMTPVQEVARGVASMESMHDTPTPSRSPNHSLQAIGAKHANISHGDLKALPRRGTSELREDIETDEFGNEYPVHEREEYEDDYDEAGNLAEPGIYDEDMDQDHVYYGQQDIPAPLRYVPYQQERRGLSPIQSVSGYTEGESEVHGHRDSRTIHTASEVSSPSKSPHRRDLQTPSSVPSNMRSREFGDEGRSSISSGYRNTMYTEDSEVSNISSGQAVRQVGGNVQMVHPNFAPESAVASLVDGSVIDPSVLSGSGAGQDYRDSQLSYEEARKSSSRGLSPAKQSVESLHQIEEHAESPTQSREHEGSNTSREFVEYELNEYGQKVPHGTHHQSPHGHSPTPSESAITTAAVGRAAAAAIKRKALPQDSSITEAGESQFTGEGVFRNRSFKERADKGGYQLNATPRHSVDRLSDAGRPELGASGLPDMDHPMPAIGYGYDDDHRSQLSSQLSDLHQDGHESQHESEHNWSREHTPTQEATTYGYDRAVTPKASKTSAPSSGHGLGVTEAAAAATIATVSALTASHSRQPSQEQEDEWQRTSGDRKRDTLVTNPYEGASPIANLPDIDGNMLGAPGYNTDNYRNGYHSGSPGVPVGDEGYISAAPNEVRSGTNGKGKEVGVLSQHKVNNAEDPFYAPQDSQHLSGLSQGMRTPLFDPATGTGIDRIQSKDIIALMEHLMVRDAQRSARDTEILVTLVRSAAEMRNSFEDIKRMLADTEDQIIGEVKDNTEKTVKRHLGGPRPFPGSSGRSIQGGSQAGTEDMPTKKRNLLRRALQGLSAKGNNDLGRIEDMLMQLLTDVDVLKHQTAGPEGTVDNQGHSLENLQPEIQYEQDRGYEPEGNAGTSTASHASHSGHLSIPQPRGGSSMRLSNERKFSDHRISTVPEDEDEDEIYPPTSDQQQHTQEGLLSPSSDKPRGGSVPLGTPPQLTPQMQQYSMSNENTPRTEEGKKYKRGSSSFVPKISRWSQTTASSIGKVFRSSGTSRKEGVLEETPQRPPSRSGSDLANYDHFQDQNVYSDDQLHTGFSEHDLLPRGMGDNASNTLPMHQPPAPATYATPEDPKYRAHRNSLNLQHPQPRPGQTERFRTALESSAQDYDSPMSPRSADWAGSATSLHRFPAQNTNRYSDNSATNATRGTEEYGWGATSSPTAQGPPRPPKEPLDSHSPSQAQTSQHTRVNKLQKKQSPLPYHSVESGYGTATHAGSYNSGSPRLENRNLSGALGVPTRRPSGPRAMTPTRGSDDGVQDERRRKRDTFGTVPSPSSIVSQESETF